MTLQGIASSSQILKSDYFIAISPISIAIGALPFFTSDRMVGSCHVQEEQDDIPKHCNTDAIIAKNANYHQDIGIWLYGTVLAWPDLMTCHSTIIEMTILVMQYNNIVATEEMSLALFGGCGSDMGSLDLSLRTINI
jgi:hypothetical protein